MKELESETYNFAIQGIGLVKSLEKEFPELANNELKHSIGAVSIKYMNALNAEKNEDFALNIKSCHSNALRSSELLSQIGEIKNNTFNQQKIELKGELKVIIERLDIVISKLIF
jgi:hypothetical protein